MIDRKVKAYAHQCLLCNKSGHSTFSKRRVEARNIGLRDNGSGYYSKIALISGRKG